MIPVTVRIRAAAVSENMSDIEKYRLFSHFLTPKTSGFFYCNLVLKDAQCAPLNNISGGIL